MEEKTQFYIGQTVANKTDPGKPIGTIIEIVKKDDWTVCLIHTYDRKGDILTCSSLICPLNETEFFVRMRKEMEKSQLNLTQAEPKTDRAASVAALKGYGFDVNPYYPTFKGEIMPENKLVKAIDTLEDVVRWTVEKQGSILTVLDYCRTMAEDTKFTVDELKRLAVIVGVEFGVTLSFPDALALSTAAGAGNLRLMKEVLEP